LTGGQGQLRSSEDDNQKHLVPHSLCKLRENHFLDLHYQPQNLTEASEAPYLPGEWLNFP